MGDIIAGLVLKEQLLLSFITYVIGSRSLSVEGRKLFGPDSLEAFFFFSSFYIKFYTK
jgi:hypothetical protein